VNLTPTASAIARVNGTISRRSRPSTNTVADTTNEAATRSLNAEMP
jgi:hypothetical protein